MYRFRLDLFFVARLLIALVFLANGFGIIGAAPAIHDLMSKGVPEHTATLFALLGRVIDVMCGLGFVAGFYPAICAVGLIAFLIPATLIAHAFWSAPAPLHQMQLINFLKNVAIVGGLLLVACGSLRNQQAGAGKPLPR